MNQYISAGAEKPGFWVGIPYGEDWRLDEPSFIDKTWFEAHPNATYRYRELLAGELEALHTAFRDLPKITRVKVTKVCGGRIREFLT